MPRLTPNQVLLAQGWLRDQRLDDVTEHVSVRGLVRYLKGELGSLKFISLPPLLLRGWYNEIKPYTDNDGAERWVRDRALQQRWDIKLRQLGLDESRIMWDAFAYPRKDQ